MDRTFRKSGISLSLAGLAGMLFFWLTDPRYSPIRAFKADTIDQINDMSVGTVVGVIGSVVVLVTGLWLMGRKSM